MIDVINLALPFFGLIVVGFVCGKLNPIPDTALAWMNFFIVYVALPALFYRILAQTPLERLTQVDFILATTLSTFLAFAISFGIAMAILRGHIGESTIAGLAGGYGNIGYMGPGLALATLGPAAAVPVALIFCFDTLLLFTLVPFLMALARPQRVSLAATALEAVKRIVSHPLVIATALGVASAAIRFEPPLALDRLMQFLQNAAAPLRAVYARCDSGSPPIAEDADRGADRGAGKIDAASGSCFHADVAFRSLRPELDLHGRVDGGAAAGAQCVRVRAPIRNLGRAGVQRRADRHAGVGGDVDQRDVDGEKRHVAATVVPLTCSRFPDFWSSTSRHCCRDRWRGWCWRKRAPK